jgi:hypothetical protein
VSRLFDTVVMVDWSAASAPSPAKPSADAIWIGVVRDGAAEEPAYMQTRAKASSGSAHCSATSARRDGACSPVSISLSAIRAASPSASPARQRP